MPVELIQIQIDAATATQAPRVDALHFNGESGLFQICVLLDDLGIDPAFAFDLGVRQVHGDQITNRIGQARWNVIPHRQIQSFHNVAVVETDDVAGIRPLIGW